MILKILNFYAVGSLFAFGITYLDCMKYKEHFDEFDYEDRHYMALFFISSVLSWYVPINYILELMFSGSDDKDSEEAKIDFLKELKVYLDVILARIFK